MNYKKRYNLDAVLEEYEKENGPVPDEAEDKVEVVEITNDSNTDVICISPSPPKKELKTSNKPCVGSNGATK